MENAIANLPSSDAVDIIWDRLRGFWTAADNQFAGFTFNRGLPTIEYGYFRTEWYCIGELTGARSTGEYETMLTFYVPATEETMLSEAREETWVSVYLDASNLPVNGKIRIKIDSQGNGGWYQYTWSNYSF